MIPMIHPLLPQTLERVCPPMPSFSRMLCALRGGSGGGAVVDVVLGGARMTGYPVYNPLQWRHRARNTTKRITDKREWHNREEEHELGTNFEGG